MKQDTLYMSRQPVKWNQIENIDVSGLYHTCIGTFYKVVVITFEKAFLAKTNYDGIAKLEFYDDSTSTTSFIFKGYISVLIEYIQNCISRRYEQELRSP